MTSPNTDARLPQRLPADAATSFAEARDNQPVSADHLARAQPTDPTRPFDHAADQTTLAAARRPAWIDTLATITTITCQAAKPVPNTLVDVVTHRRTSRPTRAADLPRLLTLTALLGTVRCIGFDDAGREWSSRATPSAGGTHSIRVLLHTYHQDDRWFVVPPTETVIDTITAYRVDVPPHQAADLQAASDACTPSTAPACLYLVADTAKLFSRYPRGTSLLWRDAGAVAATAHLLAANFDLDSAILGCGGQTLHDADYPSVLVGAIAVGTTSTRSPRPNPRDHGPLHGAPKR